MPFQPLSGIRVLDLSRLLPGPYCTMLLADMGAEVIKIETPRVGDYARFLPPEVGLSGLFAAVNRNKKSVALNYRNPRGKEIFLRLAREADVVLEGFRPGVVDRMGIGYEAVRGVNPRIIYCSLSGYGQSGPYRDRAGHDPNYLSVGGLLGLNGAAGGPPILPAAQIADLAGGMLAAIAILGALAGRERTGEGQYLDVSLIDAVVSWTAPTAGGQFFSTGKAPERGRMALTGEFPCYNIYETADGQFIALAALEPDFWAAFCRVADRADLVPRQFDHSAIMEVAAVFRQRTRAEWLKRLEGADGCAEAVYSFEEMLSHPQVRHRGLVVEKDGRAERIASPLVFTHRESDSPAPALGGNTIEILKQAGMSEEEIKELEAKGIVKSA